MRITAPRAMALPTPITSRVPSTTTAGARRSPGASRSIPCLGIDLVAPGERRAPAVVVEGSREVMGVGSAIALGAVMRIVEVQLGLVAAEAPVVPPIELQVVVDPGEDGFAVAALDQERRQRPPLEPARA